MFGTVTTLACAFVLAQTPPTFDEVHGGQYRLPGPDDCKAIVLVFISADCPISNGYMPELKRLHAGFSKKGIAFCAVYADADLGKEAARKHAKDYGIPCPAILDPNLTLAVRYGATVKPEAVLLSPRGDLLYRGRIDDRYADFGKLRAMPTKRDLHDAIAATLAGKAVMVTRTEAIGCYIDGLPPKKAIVVKNGIVEGERAQAMDKHMTALDDKGFSGILLVVQNDKIVLAKGYGLADRAKKTPFQTDTVFDIGSIGSITKQFTAAAILKLEMQGKLKIDDTIDKFFKDVPDDKRAITLHQLLTHTAGFVQELGGDYERIGRADFVKRALTSKLRTKPGKSYHYSNVGYSLLGAIIEEVTGDGYEKYLHQHLFKPAGLLQTGYIIPKWNKTKLARGYQKEKDWGTPLDHAWDKDGPYWHLRANSGLLSTAEDLYRWHVALLGDDILSRDAKVKYFGKHTREGFLSSSHYGYGWVIDKTPRGTTVIEHNGSNGIFAADFPRYVDEGAAIIVATNAFESSHLSIPDKLVGMMFSKAK